MMLQILAVNGVDLLQVAHADAIKAMKMNPGHICLTISRVSEASTL
jgi:hypothetical protein